MNKSQINVWGKAVNVQKNTRAVCVKFYVDAGLVVMLPGRGYDVTSWPMAWLLTCLGKLAAVSVTTSRHQDGRGLWIA
jgi:hypothetical protein